ncbi:MAG: 2-dehydropantoate 2-reductase [Elusimicrobia bacterium]|nr:2-dehydropantoate 2-reductase [Elusimicrobiota bacterium]
MPLTKTSVAVIGPGAMGLLVAERLGRAGARVLLVGRDRAWLSRARRGLRLEERLPSGKSRRLRVKAQPAAAPRGPVCDCVLLCVKSSAVRDALRAAKPLVGPNTSVVSLQNGLLHRPAVLKAFGRGRSVFGVSYAAAERLADRVVHHGGDRIDLAATEHNEKAASRAQAILKAAGFRVELARDEDGLLWTKAAFNAATNPIGALTGRTNGELVTIPALKDLVFRAAGEAARAARADGHRLLCANLEATLIKGLLSMPAQSNSMLQDLRAGRATERDTIVGPILSAARRRKVKTPVLESLDRLVRRVERELAA